MKFFAWVKRCAKKIIAIAIAIPVIFFTLAYLMYGHFTAKFEACNGDEACQTVVNEEAANNIVVRNVNKFIKWQETKPIDDE